MTVIEFEEERNKITKGLEIAYKNLVAFKKEKNSYFVVMSDNKISKIKIE